MFTRTRLVLQVGRAKPVYHAFTYPSRFFTTTQVQAVAAHSLDSATVNQTTQIFPDRGSTSGANETRPLKERLFGANKGAALSEQVLPKNYHSRNDVGDPSNWVAMKRGTQAAGNAVSYGSNTYRYLEEGRLGWWESREKEAAPHSEKKKAAPSNGVEPGDTVGTQPDPFVFGRGDERKSM